ncbi:MAG TPA: tail fiber protein, partial [Chloroflexota bacterium]|nr:tail fiber protein [Chloroflexota bacterium]
MQPFIGQITLVGFSFAPAGWAFCDGTLLSIDQNPTLFQLIGNIYGGDGQTTFALPDLRSRIPLHQGQGLGTSNYTIGQVGGTENVTLTINQVPTHSHQALCFAGGSNIGSPVNALWAQASNDQPYKSATTGAATMAPNAIGQAGGNQPHANVMAYQALNYIIALF